MSRLKFNGSCSVAVLSPIHPMPAVAASNIRKPVFLTEIFILLYLRRVGSVFFVLAAYFSCWQPIFRVGSVFFYQGLIWVIRLVIVALMPE